MKIVILNMDETPDSVGDIFDPAGMEVPDELPVRQGFGAEKIVGTAKLSKEGNRIVADLTLSDALPLEAAMLCTPSIGGTVFSRTGSRITKARLEGLALVVDVNMDQRIKTIGEQLAEQRAVAIFDGKLSPKG